MHQIIIDKKVKQKQKHRVSIKQINKQHLNTKHHKQNSKHQKP